MNYKIHYDNMITKIKLLNRVKSNDVYYENHHILPKSLGGSNDTDNLILLTAREHYVAHWLLYKMPNDIKTKHKMACAFFYMCAGDSIFHKRGFSSKQYELSRTILSESSKLRYTGEHNPFFNKSHTQETKDKISISRIGKCVGKDNPMFGKPRSDYVKEQVSKSNKGKRTGDENPARNQIVREKLRDGKLGDKNPNAKKWKITTPLKEVFIFVGGLKRWLIEMGTTYTKVQNPKNGWIIEEI